MKIIRVAFAIWFVYFTMTSCKPENQTETVSLSQRPNIVLIVADDLGYGDLSCYGQTHFETPNIDYLAREGMRFLQHYSGSTVCAPSRASLMTGLHTGHTYIRGNKGVLPEGQIPLNSEAVTMAEKLQEAGYITGAFGKWGMGYPGSEGDPNFQGFDTFYGYNCQTKAHHYYPYHLWHNQDKIMLEENAGHQAGQYGPDIIHKQALKFLEDHQDTTFFMFYPAIIPHAELQAPEKYMEKHRGQYPPENAYEGVDSGERYRDGPYGSQSETHATFAAMVNVLDDQVGEIRAKLQDLGIADNTLIIFTSDNGPHLEGGADPDYFNSNGALTGYKRDLTEGGIRVPMIAYWPEKITAGKVSNHISAFWDILPTVCDLVEIQKPQNIDGISFFNELIGADQDKHNFLYWEFHEMSGKQAVRMGDWKGIKLEMGNDPQAPVLLYNLETDLGEQENVAEAHPQIVEKIDSIMQASHARSDIFSFEFEN